MTRPTHHFSVRHRLVAVLVLAHMLAGMALAASPRLHHWVHPDADDDDHDCAVVLFLHGGCDLTPLAVAAPVCADVCQEISVVTFRPIRAATVFDSSSVLEHAPPQRDLAPAASPQFLA